MLRAVATILGLVDNDCNPESRFRPYQVRLFPDPVPVGGLININVVFMNEYDIIRSGVQAMSVQFNNEPYHVPAEDMCDYNAGLCPIGLGLHTLNHTFIAPNVTGTVNMKIEWKKTTTSLLCIEREFDIVDVPDNTVKNLRASE
jgi:hypothetical protein